jgi:hypothetical protein
MAKKMTVSGKGKYKSAEQNQYETKRQNENAVYICDEIKKAFKDNELGAVTITTPHVIRPGDKLPQICKLSETVKYMCVGMDRRINIIKYMRMEKIAVTPREEKGSTTTQHLQYEKQRQLNNEKMCIETVKVAFVNHAVSVVVKLPGVFKDGDALCTFIAVSPMIAYQRIDINKETNEVTFKMIPTSVLKESGLKVVDERDVNKLFE